MLRKETKGKVQEKWQVLSEMSWPWYANFQSAWLEASEPSPKPTGTETSLVSLQHLNLEVGRDSSARTSAETPPPPPSYHFSPSLLHVSNRMPLQHHYPLESSPCHGRGSCRASSRRHTTQGQKCPQHILLPLQGPYTAAVAAAPGRNGLPCSPDTEPLSRVGTQMEAGDQDTAQRARGEAGSLPGWNALLEALGGRSPGVTELL